MAALLTPPTRDPAFDELPPLIPPDAPKEGYGSPSAGMGIGGIDVDGACVPPKRRRPTQIHPPRL